VNWNHGFTGILIAYGVSAARVLVGLFRGRASDSRIDNFLLLAVAAFIAAIFLWT
jgi:hypothetical protein